mmetsp:Transcript_31192/g.101593  ORF Transcript_31192/g.101593 Transcript_31192/m.101593 type:complete len:201 (+) Transcript_31192:327-929(+)
MALYHCALAPVAEARLRASPRWRSGSRSTGSSRRRSCSWPHSEKACRAATHSPRGSPLVHSSAEKVCSMQAPSGAPPRPSASGGASRLTFLHSAWSAWARERPWKVHRCSLRGNSRPLGPLAQKKSTATRALSQLCDVNQRSAGAPSSSLFSPGANTRQSCSSPQCSIHRTLATQRGHLPFDSRAGSPFMQSSLEKTCWK